MAIRPAFLDKVQFGVESTFGTLVPANKQIMTYTAGGVQPIVALETIQPAGDLFPCGVSVGKRSGSLSLEGMMGYVAMLYAFASHYKVPVFSPSTTATITPAKGAANTPNFYTIEVGQAAALCDRMLSCHCTDISLRFNLQNPTMSVQWIGQDTAQGVTITASPTEHPCTVVTPKEWVFKVGATLGAIATLNKTTEVEFESSGRWENQFYADSVALANEIREGRPAIQVRFRGNWDSAYTTYFTQLVAGTRYIAQISCTSPDTAYTMTITMAGTFRPPQVGEADGLTQGTWTFIPEWDATLGYAISVVIKTTLTAL